MKIWELMADIDNYKNVVVAGDFIIDEMLSFDGRSKIADWNPLALKSIRNNLPYGDMVSFLADIPVVSPKVIEATKDLISQQAEVLSTLCSDCELYLLNITNRIDVVDYSKSQVKYFPDGKRVLRFIKLAFIEEKVRGNHIFKLTEKNGFVYVSDEFRQRIIDNGLTGFKFELVWDSEAE